MRIAEQPSRGSAESLIGEMLLAVCGLAHGEIPAFALLALAADDGEGHDDAVALLQLAVNSAADLEHLAHGFVAHDVAGQHARDEIVEQMQIRAADRTACDLDDGIARVLDHGIGHGVAANIFLAVPNQRFHVLPPAPITKRLIHSF
jgi:hypothetical protein